MLSLRFGLAALFLLLAPAAYAAPDIIVFLADDLGAADIGPVRRELPIATPNIDAIGAGGITFTHGYAQPACVQTRTALMSGQWPQRHGVLSNGPQPAGTMVTVAERLRDLGYQTALVGKWHLGFTATQHPLAQGFETFFGYKGITPDYYGTDPDTPLYRQYDEVTHYGLVTDILADEAVAILSAPRDRPLFLFVSWTAPHDPLQGTLAQRVAEMDAAMGRVMAAAGPDTLIYFAGDNGRGADNSPLRGRKFDILDGGIRVPLALRWDGRVAPGQVVETPASTVDFAATALAAAGGSFPDSDGHDLLALPADRTLFWMALYGEPGFAVRRREWKLSLDYQGVPVGLYRVTRAPGERNNLAASFPGVVKELSALIAGWRGEIGY